MGLPNKFYLRSESNVFAHKVNDGYEAVYSQAHVKEMEDILTAFVELENSGLLEPSRIKHQTQRARELLELY